MNPFTFVKVGRHFDQTSIKNEHILHKQRSSFFSQDANENVKTNLLLFVFICMDSLENERGHLNEQSINQTIKRLSQE